MAKRTRNPYPSGVNVREMQARVKRGERKLKQESVARRRAALQAAETRRAKAVAAANRRKRSAAKAAETRAYNKLKKRIKNRESGSFRQDVPAKDRRHNARRWYIEEDLKGRFGTLTPNQIGQLLNELMLNAWNKYGKPGYLLSGGVKIKISTEDNSKGQPIWESEKGRYDEQYIQTPFYENPNTARYEAANYVHVLLGGKRLSQLRGHYYRIWITGLIAYVLERRT